MIYNIGLVRHFEGSKHFKGSKEQPLEEAILHARFWCQSRNWTRFAGVCENDVFSVISRPTQF